MVDPEVLVATMLLALWSCKDSLQCVCVCVYACVCVFPHMYTVERCMKKRMTIQNNHGYSWRNGKGAGRGRGSIALSERRFQDPRADEGVWLTQLGVKRRDSQ
ncbi:unnamed protein product [Pipistrellus nathusii]|uniref:Secreted protein n=1 Tax=Pipistrellus nathusii TaxID=59473 RepID=A0ABP0ACH9_PIPNA